MGNANVAPSMTVGARLVQPVAPTRTGSTSRLRTAAWAASAAFAVAALGIGWDLYARPPLVEVFSTPTRFSRRTEEFTVNVCGITSRAMKYARRRLRFRANQGAWRDIHQDYVSSHSRHFRIELPASALVAGDNQIEIEAEAIALRPQRLVLPFHYDPQPLRLPIRVAWERPDVEVEDGAWHSFDAGGERRVRPTPGHEGYDRILIVAGAFAGGRRVRTDVTFRHAVQGRPYGFGVIPMWGGRPDDVGVVPRRGWNLGLVWWWDRYEGFGAEFSYKRGPQSPGWVNSYRDLALEAGRRYRIVAEAWPVSDALGKHSHHVLRAKWWPDGTPEPSGWLQTSDTEGSPLPKGDYGVGLMAFWSQVEFGPILIEPIPGSG